MKLLIVLSIFLTLVPRSGHMGRSVSSSSLMMLHDREIRMPAQTRDIAETSADSNLANVIGELEKKFSTQRVDFLKQDFSVLASMLPRSLVTVGIKKLGSLDLSEIMEDFSKLSFAYDTNNQFVGVELSRSTTRHGGVCLPADSTVIINPLTYQNVGFNLLWSSTLLLHEALCATPSPTFIGERKYDDSNYQISSRIAVLALLITAKNIDYAKNLADDQVFIGYNMPISVLLGDGSSAGSRRGGGISGGPGGGNMEALNFLSHLLYIFEKKRIDCSLGDREFIPVSGIEKRIQIPCEWFNSPEVRRQIYNAKAEGPSPSTQIAEEFAQLGTGRVVQWRDDRSKSAVFIVSRLAHLIKLEKTAEDALTQLYDSFQPPGK